MKHIHRAHMKPLECDSNAAQFARQGNPWDGEGLLRRKSGRRKRRGLVAPPVRRPERSSRDASEAMLDYQCRQALAAKLGVQSRTIASEREPKSPTLAILPVSKVELTRWQCFERQVVRCAQRGAVLKRLAEGMERNRVRDEKARLRSIVKAAEARLAELV